MSSAAAVVTGAFSNTGKYITRRLLAMGKRVVTLTNHPERPNPFGQPVAAYPYDFDRPERLAESLRGADVLYNTYWVRFPYGSVDYSQAVENTRALVRAASQAGVRRIVHVSITNPSPDSPFPYFSGKALLEEEILRSGLSYAILRPAVIFGAQGILFNNIAYLLRRLPVFAIPASGQYRLQPIFVDDLAELAVQEGESGQNRILDAIGPETYAFADLVHIIAAAVGSRALVTHVPPGLALGLSQIVSRLVGDIILTRDEVDGLLAGLLETSSPPVGRTRFSDWLKENAREMGKEYASEMERHYR